MTISPRAFLAACALTVSLPAAASAQVDLEYAGCGATPSCCAPCEPTCCAPTYCEPVCAAPVYAAPACAAPVCGDVCAPSYAYCQPERESCLKRFCRKMMDMEHRKNAWLKKTFCGLCEDDCAPACDCAPTCAAPVYYAEPACAAPTYYAPACAAPAACGCN